MITDLQKTTFAEIYKLAGAMKNEIKSIEKINDQMLYVDGAADWDRVTRGMNTIVASAELIARLSQEVGLAVDNLLSLGPYEGQRAGVGPLEAMALGRGQEAERE